MVANEYDGRTKEYAARTHERDLDAGATQYAGRTIVYVGRTGISLETLNETCA